MHLSPAPTADHKIQLSQGPQECEKKYRPRRTAKRVTCKRNPGQLWPKGGGGGPATAGPTHSPSEKVQIIEYSRRGYRSVVGKVCVPDIRKRIHFVTNFFRISKAPIGEHTPRIPNLFIFRAKRTTSVWFGQGDRNMYVFRWQKNARTVHKVPTMKSYFLRKTSLPFLASCYENSWLFV